MTALPTPKSLLPAAYVDENNLIIEASKQNIFTQNPSGTCYYTTDVIVFGNKNICIFWQKIGAAPKYREVLKSLEWLQKYINYGTNVMSYTPKPFKKYTGADGITRQWVIEVNKELCSGYGGGAYNGYSWCAFSQDLYSYLVNTVNYARPTMHQVIFYEMGRCMYDTALDNILDWQMQDPSEFGFWTLGFNGAMTVLAPEYIGCELEYAGQNTARFRLDRLNDLKTYINGRSYNFNNTWCSKFLPWNRNQSINDVMSGLLIYLADKLGYGYGGIQRVFYLLKEQPRTPSKLDRQQRATNFYRAVYQSTLDLLGPVEAKNMYTYFSQTLKWNFVPQN